MVAANVVTELELGERYPSHKEAIAGINLSRNRRVLLAFELIVYDVTTYSVGLLRDISETGLRVAGINCNVGEQRTFQIPVDTIMKADPLLVVGECKWLKVRGKIMPYPIAGFEIIDISDDDRPVLKRFVELSSIIKSGYWHNDDMGKRRVAESIIP